MNETTRRRVASAPRRIAVVPAYNEEPMVAAVLEELYPLVDELVVVDDGSTDNTRAEIEQWMARGRPNCRLLVHEVNRGMSEAYLHRAHRAARTPRTRRARRDDLVFTVDADGQHDLHVLDELVEMTRAEGLDANIARRDLSYHGPFKRTGNWVLSKWASAWAGAPLHDVESGYRIFRLGRARARARLLLGLPVQRDGRGRGRAVPARLQGAQRPRRTGAGRSVANPAARRGDRPCGHPGGRGAGLAARPAPRCVPDRRNRAPRDRSDPRSAHRADVPAFDRHGSHPVPRLDLRRSGSGP